ncbi:MAG TPA: DUF222 domain-containing protein [Pseudolysinimonas sp.]|nr:DUF222 domain-containing protein [Pseudolysinimonas sp.]
MSPTSVQTFALPDLGTVTSVTDAELIALQRECARARRQVDAAAAVVAGEVARRSARELGYSGLAQRAGARTPEGLIAHVAGVSGADARALVRAGELMSGSAPWMSAVTSELSAGRVSVAAAAAIHQGLGEPGESVSGDDLARAAERLLVDVSDLPPEKVVARARQERDELDAAGVADRETELRSKRFLRLIPQADGMTRIVGLLDPENAALVVDAIDRVTAPRRGGVRFVDPAEQAREQSIIDDVRTTPQLAIDALVQMVRMAGSVDDGRVFGVRGPQVRVHVTLADLDRRGGFGHIEGQSPAISIPTVERQICAQGLVPILFDDDGSALNLGRTQRLFSTKQRIVIAARDGGCLVTGCERPPSWTEVHHINEWDAHHGFTDVDDGVSLCRHHHMWVHDSGARIRRTGARYRIVHADSREEALMSKPLVRREVA